ncbi:MAG TPA: T9SS type A sorting domain-containing protein [Ignavibacteriaceae bacterium]|nr:T9SS type A sorting domain-containing protein [Ignavibacteriaceae bacterium]
MKKIILFPLLITFLLSAQPENPGPHQAGWTSETLNRDGRNLNSIIYYPSFEEGSESQIDTLNGAYPVIAFGHGFFMQNSYYISIFKHLASYGYVVIAPQFPDNNHLQLGYDLIFCADHIKSQNQNPDSRFYNLIDTTKTGLSGHSMGGGASLLAAANSASVTVAAPLAAAETNPSAISVMNQIQGVVYLISAQNDGITPVNTNQLPMFNDALPVKGLPVIKGGNHTKSMDTRIWDWTDPNGYLTPAQQLTTTRKYLTSIFNLFLKEDTTYFKYAFGSEAQTDTSIIFQYELKPLVPMEFTLISPTDTLTETSITFIWNNTYSLNLYDEINYELIIASDEFFNNVIFQSGSISDTTFSTELQNGSYFWKVKAFTSDSTFTFSNTLNFIVDIPTGINESKSQFYEFRLEQNYPNPFNSKTIIEFVIPIPTSREKNLKDFSSQAPRNDNMMVTLKVYNILGNEVATLVSSLQQPGNYEVEFDGSNLSSGVYLYKIQIGERSLSCKMILMK